MRRAVVLASLGGGMLGAPLCVHAQIETAVRAYAIPAGPLENALTRFALDSGLMLSYTAEDIAGLRTEGLFGSHEVSAGLDKLLSGTGLTARPQPNGGVILRRAPVVQHSGLARESSTTLKQIDIVAPVVTETAYGAVPGRVARQTATGTRTDTPLIEVPQSISVISRSELDSRGAQSVMEALRYVPGVAVDSYGVETRGSEWALMRGFDSNATSNLVDGLRYANSNWINFLTETYGVERIEVLRGPASVSYGQTEVGGTIHRINKRPNADAPREIEVQTGSYGRKQVAADVGGALNAEGTLLYRVVGLALDTDNQLRFSNGVRASNERQYLAPSLTWRPSADTSLTFRAERLRNVSKGFSILVVRNGQNTGLLRGDPDHLSYDQEQSQLGYELQHRINDRWTLRQNVRHARATVDNLYINQLGGPIGNVLQRSIRHGDDALRQTSVDTNLTATFQTGRVAHHVLMGVDWSDARADYQERHAAPGTTPPLNLDAPAYGVPFPDPSVLRTSSLSTTRQFGVYVQDQIKVKERWVITLGGRQDSVANRAHDRLGDAQTQQRDRAFSGRAGLTFLAPRGVAPYVSFGQSFLPQTLRTPTGDPYQPTRGRQWEAGVKFQPPGTETLATMALFDLTKSNVDTYDGVNDVYAQTGKVRSRGLELELKTRVMAGLYVFGAYTYNDVEVVRSSDTDLGKTPIQVPRQMVSAGLDYSLSGVLQGFSVGAGVRHVGRRYDNAANTQSTPAFTLVDAALRYDNGTWRVALNVANLFDKTYVASRAYGGYYPGAERTATLSARYRF